MLRASARAACSTRLETSVAGTSASTRTRDSGSSVTVVVTGSVAMAVSLYKPLVVRSRLAARFYTGPAGPSRRGRRRLGGAARALEVVSDGEPLQASAHRPITRPMKTFLNLRLSARLGAAFGFLVLALVVIGRRRRSAAWARSTTKPSRSRDRDVAGLQELVTVSEDFLASGYLRRPPPLRRGRRPEGPGPHRRRRSTSFQAEARKTARRTRPAPRERRGQAHRSPSSSRACATSRPAPTKAIELSRQETVDGVEERDGSRTVYTDEVAKVFERLDVFHDKLEERGRRSQAEAGVAACRGDARRPTARTAVLIVVAIAVLAAIGLALLVTRSVTRPVAALGARLRSLNDHCLQGLGDGLVAIAEGDLTRDVQPVTTPVEVRSKDELGQLGETFNEMLGKAQGGLQSYNEMRGQLGVLIGEVSAGAGTVSAASEQMASTSDEAGRAVGEIASAVGDVAMGAERQVRMVEETREAVLEAARAAEASATTAASTTETVEQAREAFEVIGLAVESMTERVAEIAGAVQQISAESQRAEGGISEVAAVAEQSSASAEQVSASTQETSASTQEIASSAAELAKTAEQLDQLVRRFKVSA